jgi:ubiquinone biosynthesis protein Coq4
MGRKRKSQDNHGEAPRPSHAQRQADQAHAFDEAREKMAKDPSRRNIFDEHPFYPNLDVER